ncbi:hypothetical protein F4703DRAFT_1965102, partial [Phycomyces blakesleeanus]
KPGESTITFKSKNTFCEECQKDYARPSTLKRHMESNHVLSNEGPSSSTERAAIDDLTLTLNETRMATTIMTEAEINQYNCTSDNEDETEAEDNEYNGKLQDDQVFDPYFGNDISDHDSFYNSITNSMSSFDDEVLDAENDSDTAETDTNTDPANIVEQIMKDPIAGCHPFPDLQTMVLCALVDGNNDMVSQRMMKKILFAMNMISKIQANITEQGTFKLPKLNALMNYHWMKKNRITVFPSTKVDVPESSPMPIPAYINIPTVHLRFLIANPSKAGKITSLPDRTPDQSISLQQGIKWKEHELYQQPMLTINNVNVWAGFLMKIYDAADNKRFLVKDFHTANHSTFARGYLATIDPNDVYYLDSATKDVKVEDLDTIDPAALGAIYVSHEPTSASGLNDYHHDLLYKDHCFKCLVLDSAHVANSGLYYKVRIAPIIFFTDDISGNWSKQFNPYESWSMKLAGLSYEECSLIANILFLLAIPKKNDVSGMSLLPTLIRDLKKLENDIVVYSAEDNAYILLVAPLL